MKDHKKVDTSNKRNPQQMLKDRTLIAEWFLQAVPSRTIAERLNKINPYTLSHVQITMDIKAIIEQWKTEQAYLIDERMESDLMKLEKLENEAWEAWERSKGVKTTKSATRKGEDETSKSLKEETLIGDAKFLDLIRNILQDRANLLGYMAPKKVDTTVSVSVTNKIAEMGADAIKKEIDRLRLVNSLN
jgi:hypothetical protein